MDSCGWVVVGGIALAALAMADEEEEGEEDGGGRSVSETCVVFTADTELLEVCGRGVWLNLGVGDCWVLLLLSCSVPVEVVVLCFPMFLGGVVVCSNFKGWFVCPILGPLSSEMTGTWQWVDDTSSLQ